MSPQSARTTVLLVAGLMFAAIALRRDRIQDPYRYAWAAGLISLFLSFLADVVPQIAGPFAILLGLAVWYRHRADFPTIAGPSGAKTSSSSSGNLAQPKTPAPSTPLLPPFP